MKGKAKCFFTVSLCSLVMASGCSTFDDRSSPEKIKPYEAADDHVFQKLSYSEFNAAFSRNISATGVIDDPMQETREPAVVSQVFSAADLAQAKNGSTPLLVSAKSDNNSTHYNVGDKIKVSVISMQDAHIYCYYQDAIGQVFRLFPNRFQTDNSLRAGQTLSMPDSDQWEITATHSDQFEQFMCLAVPADVDSILFETINHPDLFPLKAQSLDQVHSQYQKVTANDLVSHTIELAVR